MSHMFADPLKMQQLAGDLERIARGTGPTALQLENAPILMGWHVHVAQVAVLTGVAIGHPDRPDGPVTTSQLYALDYDTRLWARTMNRWYSLGDRTGDNPDR